MIDDKDVEAFLAHHGVKGMKWGQKKTKAVTAVKTTGRAVGRAGSATGRFVKRHPKGTAEAVGGVAFVASVLYAKKAMKLSEIPKRNARAAKIISENSAKRYKDVHKSMLKQTAELHKLQRQYISG